MKKYVLIIYDNIKGNKINTFCSNLSKKELLHYLKQLLEELSQEKYYINFYNINISFKDKELSIFNLYTLEEFFNRYLH